MTPTEMVAKFQCPGCVCGISPQECGSFNYHANEKRCTGHVLGISFGTPDNCIAIGLPRGFNKPGWEFDKDGCLGKIPNRINMRLFPAGEFPPIWDHLNVPVWAMEKDGFLFVRTYAPRINVTWVDVIECGTLAMVPNAIDVSLFSDEID